MKATTRLIIYLLLYLVLSLVSIKAATTYTLNPAFNFGTRGDGSAQPGDSIGTSPVTGLPVIISAPGVTNAWNPGEIQYDVRPTGSTNGFNMRGLTWDSVSGNLIFCDTHLGSGGQSTNFPWSAIYILDATTGQIIGALNTNGISGGSYTFVVPGVSDDGVVYVCNQVTASQNNAFKIYRYPTADTNNPAITNAPVVAYSGFISNDIGTASERLGQTMDVRGAGTNTQIIVGSSGIQAGTGQTNVFLFTTTDGTNFVPRRIAFTNITTSSFNDGIAFGPGNTFFAKQVGKPMLYMAWDTNDLATGTNQIRGAVISSFSASSVNDALLNISAISYDPVRKLLAGLEEIGGTATGGRGKVWLYDFSDPSNRAPAVLASRTYIPNYQKTTAPMGYARFSTNGVLFTDASNNGFLVSTVDSVVLNPPTFTTDLPTSTRIAEGQNVHFEVFAVMAVTNYQWYSNNVAISGATTYFYDLPNVTTNMSGSVFKVIAYNAAGSATSVNSSLTVVNASQFFHPVSLWSVASTNLALNNTTNIMTTAASGTPNERTLAYNPASNQLIVVRGPTLPNLKIMVIDADHGTNGYSYTLKTNGMAGGSAVFLAGVGCSDDGAVYAATVSGAANSDFSFRVYRWANTDPNTLPVAIFGTNTPATNYVQFPNNPVSDFTGSQFYRFGDTMAARGSGTSTEIILDAQNNTKFVGILTPVDGTMTNWTQTGYLLQNIQGSYGSEAYGTTIGRSIQFGNGNTFYQKRYNAAAGSPFAKLSYTPGGGGLAPLVVASTSPGIFTNASVGINPTLNVAAGLTLVNAPGTASSQQDVLGFFDVTDPAQAVLLSTHPLPQGGSIAQPHAPNGNAVGQVLFAFNPATSTNYIFVLDGNNGLAAFVLSGGITPPPIIVRQPANLRVLEGNNGASSVTVDQIATIRWYKGTNSPVFTGITGAGFGLTNATLAAAGDYFCIASNLNGAVTSAVFKVSIALPEDNYSLLPLFTAIAGNGSFPYVTPNGGANTPNERAFAYNAISNQLIVVRCPPGVSPFTVYVVDGTTGSNLYTLNTSGVIQQGNSEVSGANPINLVGAAAAADGSLYICCESPNGSGGQFADTSKMFRVYRWTNTAASTPPVNVYVGDPANQPPGINVRWGDVLCARGSGQGVELFLNSFDGAYGSILKPTDATLNTFTNYPFGDSAGGGSIGRSVQFGAANSVYEKRKGSPLLLSSYDVTNQVSAGLQSIDFGGTLGAVAVDSAKSLVAGVDFVGNVGAPDAVSLYDISDPTSPLLLGRTNFPANQVANANFICQTIFTGSRVYALDGNNGLLAFSIVPPANSMLLSITPSGANVNLSWGNTSAILQSTSDLSGAPTWTDIAGPGITNSVQSVSGNKYYRLIQRL